MVCDITQILDVTPLGSGDYSVIVSEDSVVWQRLQLTVRLLSEMPQVTKMEAYPAGDGLHDLIIDGFYLDHAGLVLLIDGDETSFD